MPIFRVPLTNIMARVGQKIKLECEITGTPRPQIHWTHNSKPFSGRDFKVIGLIYVFLLRKISKKKLKPSELESYVKNRRYISTS